MTISKNVTYYCPTSYTAVGTYPTYSAPKTSSDVKSDVKTFDFGDIIYLPNGDIKFFNMNFLGDDTNARVSNNSIFITKSHLEKKSFGNDATIIDGTYYIASNTLKSALQSFKKIPHSDVTKEDICKLFESAKDAKFIGTEKVVNETFPLTASHLNSSAKSQAVKFVEAKSGKEVSQDEIKDYFRKTSLEPIPSFLLSDKEKAYLRYSGY